MNAIAIQSDAALMNPLAGHGTRSVADLSPTTSQTSKSLGDFLSEFIDSFGRETDLDSNAQEMAARGAGENGAVRRDGGDRDRRRPLPAQAGSKDDEQPAALDLYPVQGFLTPVDHPLLFSLPQPTDAIDSSYPLAQASLLDSPHQEELGEVRKGRPVTGDGSKSAAPANCSAV
ncbi:MAG: hypothetical protein QM757_20205 [Paludibaculum sp.]